MVKHSGNKLLLCVIKSFLVLS